MERQQAHYKAFLAGAKSLDVAGCSTKPLLMMSPRRVVSQLERKTSKKEQHNIVGT